MKTKKLKSLALNKKAIANITATELKGGIWTTTISTIGNITNSCPVKCGSQK